MLTIAANKKGISKFLQFKPLQYLGDISYSIYLMHSPAMFFLAIPLLSKLGYIYKGPGSLHIPFYTGLWTCATFLAGSILLSSVTYYFIEKPCRNWLNRKFDK